MHNTRTQERMFQVLSNNYIDNATINIQQADQIRPGFYATVFSIPMKASFTFEQFNKGMGNLTDNKLQIEADSLYQADDIVYRCILSSAAESHAYTEEAVKELGLHPVRANVFTDESNDVIWKLEGEGDTKRLVQDSDQDYGALLEAKRSRSPIIASDAIYVPYEESDYAYFFNHKTCAMDFGYIVNRNDTDYVLSRATNELVPIVSPSQIIIADVPEKIKNPANKKNSLIASGAYEFNSYLDYLRQMYGSDNPYYKAWEKALKGLAIQ